MNNLSKGDRFGKLVFNGELYFKDGRTRGLFDCDCGTLCEKVITRVVNGYVLSCGCLVKNNLNNLKHGMKYTKEYSSWQSCKQRVVNPKNKNFDRYSKFKHDKKLLSKFENFFEEVGYAPTKYHSIDRIDNTKGYVKGNLRWATPKEQNNNKSNTYSVIIKGIHFLNMSEAAKFHGVTKQTVHKWCFGWTDKRRNKIWEKKEWTKIIMKY